MILNKNWEIITSGKKKNTRKMSGWKLLLIKNLKWWLENYWMEYPVIQK